MNYQPAAPVAWGLRLAAVVLFAAPAALGYATYGDRAGTAAAHMRADVDAFGAYWAGSGVPGKNPACVDRKFRRVRSADVSCLDAERKPVVWAAEKR